MTSPRPGRHPSATYRLQLRREFGFTDAAAVVPYLAALGVSHVYCSPILQAVPGSPHGYDVVDHSRVSEDLGGADGWSALVEACRGHGLRLVVDVVPNHMAIPTPVTDNRVLADVLVNGEESAYAHWFDVDWAAGDGMMILPTLPEGAGDIVEGHCRRVDWRRGARLLNYRRFFDVTTLIGVRVEEPDVFDATHARVLELVRRGDIDGLRIDHPDGLADPRGYLDRLHEASGGVWTVVEKILEPGEELPRSWQCSGTTGYDAITAITHVLLDPAGEAPLTRLYAEVTGETAAFEAVVERSKRHVVEHLLGAEVDRLVRELMSIAAVEGHDADESALRDAVASLLVGFDVYRAYADEPAAKARTEHAVAQATEHAPDRVEEIRWIAGRLGTRFEQTTGPVMAKGVEDTAFYRYLRLTALNEVGGDPGAFGLPVGDWHAHCQRLVRDWPHAMTTLTTHDTKRSEDVRARLLVLAEIPDEWAAAVARWRAAAGSHTPPDAATDYLFWQTLVGAWPLTVDRMQDYLAKATHEAKVHTSWTDPDERYDDSLRRYAAAVFADDALMADVEQWARRHVQGPGKANALAQKLLQLTMPGVPDVYQGQELTEPTLVDPDNRRPVDYDRRRQHLDRLAQADRAGDGVDAKLLVTARSLQLRRERPATFDAGYAPLTADGPAAEHVIAYTRGDSVAVVVTRLPAGLARRGGAGETTLTLPPGRWHNVLGPDVLAQRAHSGTIRLSEALATLPVALYALQDG